MPHFPESLMGRELIVIIQNPADIVQGNRISEYMNRRLLEILGGKGGEGMERFVCRTEVVSGENALSALGQLGCRRLLVVTEADPFRDGRIKRIGDEAGRPDMMCFENVDPEPTMCQAVEGSRAIKSFCPDLVAAIGGRNVLDCAKAMVCFSGQECRLAVIPTAFGIGSEVSDSVMLTHNNRRHTLQNERMRPQIALLDDEMTGELPSEGVAEAGFELLALALEVFASGRSSLGQFHAREAFCMTWGALPAAFAGSTPGRRRMQTASVLTGMAMNGSGTGLGSALISSLGIVFGLSRGKAAGIAMPAIMGCNAYAAGAQYARLAGAAGLGGSRDEIGIRNLRTGLVRMRRELGLPGTLVQAGIDIRSVWNSGRQIVEMTLEDPACRNNPVAVDDFLVRRILEEITGRI